MSDEEETFSESEGGSDFSASEEDEWVPKKDSKKKKKGPKSKDETSSSSEDESDAGSEDDSDLEDFEPSPKKTGKGKQAAARKRPAPKTTPKATASGGAKRKRLSPGLRDRLYQQYKKDLLKEIAPARAPLNSSLSDILHKCQYQRKRGETSAASQSKAAESDSSGDDHLVDPEKLDLGSTFFNKHDASKQSGEPGPPQFDVNAGMRLSDSSDGEGQGTSGATGEKLLPASIPKQAADRLLSHINQQSGEFMNFHNLDQFTAKVEEAKRFLKNYQQQRATEHDDRGRTAGDDARSSASGASRVEEDSVSNLLALGETDAAFSTSKVRSNVSSDSEWEEVPRTDEGQQGASNLESEQKPKDVTIEMETAQSRRKRREELEMELYIKRQINRVKRANQLNYHKCSVLAAVAIGQRLNRTIDGARVRGPLISIMQEKANCSSADELKWDEKKVQKLADWFATEFTLHSSNYLGTRTGCGLSFALSLALYTRRVACRRDYVLLFLACLRVAGATARLVLSASVPSKRPAMNDLCPMSERRSVKENAEKRLSNQGGQGAGVESKHEPKSEPTEEKVLNEPLKVPKKVEKEEASHKKTPTKENAKEKVLQNASEKVLPPRRSARKALTTLNIPQLDGGNDDDDVESVQGPSGNVLPLRRSLRSAKGASAVPGTESPGTSPFTKRKSNTAAESSAGANAKSLSSVSRKRKLFPTKQTDMPMKDALPPAAPTKRSVRARGEKKGEQKPAAIKESIASRSATIGGQKVLGNAIRPGTPSDNDDFVTTRNKSKKLRKKEPKPSSTAPKDSVGDESKVPASIRNVPMNVLTKVDDSVAAKAEDDAKEAKKQKQLEPPNQANRSINRKVLSSDSSDFEDFEVNEKKKSTTTTGKRVPPANKSRTSRTKATSKAKSDKQKGRKSLREKDDDDDDDYDDDAAAGSANDDSDFELPKEPAQRKRKSGASGSAAKAKKSPSVRRRNNGTGPGPATASTDKTDVWIEFYCEKSKRWITYDLATGRTDCVDHIVRNATSPIAYVFAWDNAGFLKDITARYVQNWNTACRMLRVEPAWLDAALAPFAGPKTKRDLLEDKELNRLDADKPLPKTIGELKNHPLYALRRHLLKFQALYPAEPPTLGFIRGEAIYPRECVHTLQTREKWYKQARVVRPFETAYKVVKCWKYDRPTNTWLKDQPCDIFGHWQTAEYDPPTAENGIVPRNEYGNVELFTERMLPKGTVHLKLPGLNKVCRRLQIDCAPALTGFDMAKLRVVPVYDGFVVCAEFAEQAVEEWYVEMEQEERREQEKMEKRVYGNWKRLIKGLLVRRKLQHKYNFDNLA